MAVVAVLVTADGRDRAAPTPAVGRSTTSASAPTNVDQPYSVDGRMEQALATDADHLYAVQLRCTTADENSCASVLYGSDDGGKTWTERKRGIASGLQALAPGVLGAFITTSVSSVAYRISADGGRTWKDSKPASGTIPAVPAGGWPTCVEEQRRDSGRCAVLRGRSQTGAQRKLASQPSTIRLQDISRTPPGTGLWATGYVQQGRYTGVAVSHDNGRTWSTHVFGQDEPDYPTDINNQQVGIATVDGDHRVRRRHRRRQRRQEPAARLPQRRRRAHVAAGRPGARAAVAAARRTRVRHRRRHPGRADRDRRPRRVVHRHRRLHEAGTDDRSRARRRHGQPVRYAPGVYTAFDRTGMYTSPDGLHWTRHEVRPS